MRTTIQILIVAALCAGCQHLEQSFRLERAEAAASGGDLLLIPPNVRAVGSDRFALDFPVMTKPDQSGCARPSKTHGDVTGSLAPDLRSDNTDATFRLVVKRADVGSRHKLMSAWSAWLKDAAESDIGRCLGDAALAVIGRRLGLERPIPVSELAIAQFSWQTEGAVSAPRATLLRPGMHVCGVDAVVDPKDPDKWYQPGNGPVCAQLTQRPGGGLLFDAFLGRIPELNAELDPPKSQPVASWGEMPGADHKLSEAAAFILWQPLKLRRSQSGGKLRPIDQSQLIATNSGLAARVVLSCAGKEYGEKEIETICLNGKLPEAGKSETPKCVKDALSDPEVIADRQVGGSQPEPHKAQHGVKCFRFGARGMLTAGHTVWVQTSAVDVGVGTTLGDLVARFIAPPSGLPRVDDNAVTSPPDLDGARAVHRLRLERPFRGRLHAVELEGAGAAALSLPMLPGDQLSW